MRSGEIPRRLVFVHGAGGFVEDRRLADALGAALGADVLMPRLPEEDMSFAAWAALIRPELAGLGADDLVVGHSFGASALLAVLREPGLVSGNPVALLAMPDWGPDGWAVDEYVLDGAQPECPVSLQHCRDDAVVPFAHVAMNASAVPSAEVIAYASGGHQFEGRAAEIASWLTRR